MNILYVAARYHTNQIPIVEGWIRNGHNVTFISQYKGKTEDYRLIEPIVLGYSKTFLFLLKIYRMIKRKKLGDSSLPELFEAKMGVPPKKKLKEVIESCNPDLIIMRDYSLYNLVVYRKYRKIPCILYTQSPLYSMKTTENFIKKTIKKFFPPIGMTPVWGGDETRCEKKSNTYYVPFVMETRENAENKNYLKNNNINILDVGKFEKRKNHKLLIEALYESGYSNYTLTIVGEVSTLNHEKHYQEIVQLLEKKNMSNKVVLLKNLSQEEIYKLYDDADIFVLPSTREWASISQLEAMSCGTMAICSDTNGTAEYIKDGESGFLFKDCDKESLKKILELIFNNKDLVEKMGKASLKRVKENYGFSQYMEKIKYIMEQEFK